ncbi:uncharacterized protein LOC144449497 [Glandiceps talaboti]
MEVEKFNTLRLITYLSPSIPIELFQTILYYLEEKLNKEAYLIYESRWSGPCPDRVDPFTSNEADIGFMCSPPLMKLLHDTKAPVELLPAAPVYMHPRAQGRPVYFSDVIIHKDNKERFKDFINLRGSKWAYNDIVSLSGCYSTLRMLKKMGESTSFFGEVVQSGAHVNSIKLVLDGTVDCATIDSNCLAYQMKLNPTIEDNIHIVNSIGPLPVQPIGINSRLPDKMKQEIANALLTMHSDSKWGPELNKCLVSKFVEVSLSDYRVEDELRNEVNGFIPHNVCR